MATAGMWTHLPRENAAEVNRESRQSPSRIGFRPRMSLRAVPNPVKTISALVVEEILLEYHFGTVGCRGLSSLILAFFPLAPLPPAPSTPLILLSLLPCLPRTR